MRHLTVLQLNDLHGYLAPHPELFDITDDTDVRPGGGLARIAAMFRAIRRDVDGALLAFDNGDTFHGTLPAVRTHGAALIRPMAALGLDGMTMHWELAYGLRRLRELAAALPYPMLAANLHDGTGTLALQPHRMLRRDRGVDLVVVVSHLGFPQDCKLAAAVSGIDVLLSGHTHNRLETPALINGTLIMQSGAHGSFAGRLVLGARRTPRRRRERARGVPGRTGGPARVGYPAPLAGHHGG